jgi:hypothetical protein
MTSGACRGRENRPRKRSSLRSDASTSPTRGGPGTARSQETSRPRDPPALSYNGGASIGTMAAFASSVTITAQESEIDLVSSRDAT